MTTTLGPVLMTRARFKLYRDIQTTSRLALAFYSQSNNLDKLKLRPAAIRTVISVNGLCAGRLESDHHNIAGGTPNVLGIAGHHRSKLIGVVWSLSVTDRCSFGSVRRTIRLRRFSHRLGSESNPVITLLEATDRITLTSLYTSRLNT